MKFCLLILVFLTLASVGAQASEVITATDKDFDSIIQKGEIALVKFYAPWCGHCQKLAPEWEKAAKELPNEALLVDVDCTKEVELAKKYEVRGYPTIVLFRDGKVVEKYEGNRQSEDIVRYIKSNLGPSVTIPSSAEELKSFRAENDVVCVTVTSDMESPVSKIVANVAQTLRSKIKFAIVTDPTFLPEQKIETIVVYRNTEKEEEQYNGKLEEESLKEFLLTAILPFAGEISPLTFKKYAESLKPNGWVFLKPNDDASTKIKTQLVELGKKMRQHVSILWVDSEKYDGVTKHLGLPDETKYPAFVIAKGDAHYVLPPSEAATVDTIERFILEFSEGLVKASMKSQPVPEVDTVDGLTTIVAKTMSDYLSSGKDILIEFFAPWCGHCKRLAPIYAKVAKEFESSDVIIASMDATENDVNTSVFQVSGFPTVYFVPHGEQPILFSGERTFYGLYKFVREHGSEFKGQNIPEEEIANESDNEKADL